MTLLAAQFHEFHSTALRATPERAYRAIKDVTAGEIFLFRTLTWLRRFGRPGSKSILHARDASRRRFAAYWRLVSLGSAFIRLMWLRAIKHRAEAEST